MNFPEQIVSERIILKRPFPATFVLAESLYTVVDNSRETLREWLPWVDNTHSAENEFTDYLINWCQKHWEDGNGYAYLIHDKQSDQILGAIDIFHVTETDKSGEIGYWLANEAVGKGIMQEAVRALEGTAFQLGLNRITIRNDTQNTKSVRVAQRAGYHLDGILRQDAWDKYHQRFRDTNIWSKLQSEREKEC